jgi:hypothetical protein
LIAKGLNFLRETKRRQADEKMGFATEAPRHRGGQALGREVGRAETHGVAQEGRDETETLSVGPYVGYYRISYYLSNVKLKTVD